MRKKFRFITSLIGCLFLLLGITSLSTKVNEVKAADMQMVEKVTDTSSLSIGDTIVIVAAGSDFALSTTQNTNNRKAVPIIKTPGVAVPTDVQIITLESGTVEGTFAFSCVNETKKGYLYAASSSSNHLKTQDTINGNASWKVSIANNDTSIVAQGTFTRNTLKHNSGNNLFACYSSGQSAVEIWKVGSGQVEEIPATEASFASEHETLQIGESFTVDLTVLPTNHTDTIIWSADPESIVTVQNGVITAQSVGETLVTATLNETVSAIMMVSVIENPALSLTLDKETAILDINETLTLTPTITWTNPDKECTDDLIWKSSDESIAIVDNGLVTPKKAGQVIITATAGTQSATCTIQIKGEAAYVLGGLVTNVNQLQENQKIIIISEKNGINYTISPETKTNNRDGVVFGDIIAGKTVNPTAAEIITLKPGTVTGSFAFLTDDGYLSAATGTNNRLTTEKDLSALGSYIISFDSENTSVVSQGTTDRNTLLLNYNGGKPLFACYANTNVSNTNYSRVSIYLVEKNIDHISTFHGVQTSATASSIRVLGQIDSLNYTEVGFDLEVIDSANPEITLKGTFSTQTVYTSVVNGAETMEGYFFCFTLNNIPKGSYTLTVNAYAVNESNGRIEIGTKKYDMTVSDEGVVNLTPVATA